VESPVAPSRSWRLGLHVGTAAIALVGVLCLDSNRRSLSGTFDESSHLATGLEWRQFGSYTMWTENPPLPRLAIAALPYFHGMRLPPRAEWDPKTHEWDRTWELGTDLLYAGAGFEQKRQRDHGMDRHQRELLSPPQLLHLVERSLRSKVGLEGRRGSAQFFRLAEEVHTGCDGGQFDPALSSRWRGSVGSCRSTDLQPVCTGLRFVCREARFVGWAARLLADAPTMRACLAISSSCSLMLSSLSPRF